jgi:hypothetical protein
MTSMDRVEQFHVKNQFLIYTEDGVYFQSYNSIIAFKPYGNKKIRIGKDWDYSVTTGKYRNLFLNETKKDTEQNLKDGTYIYDPNL